MTANLGLSHFALGRALQAGGKLEPARTALRAAVRHLDSSLGDGHPATRSAHESLEAVGGVQ
jgi:hypothetical protein